MFTLMHSIWKWASQGGKAAGQEALAYGSIAMRDKQQLVPFQ